MLSVVFAETLLGAFYGYEQADLGNPFAQELVFAGKIGGTPRDQPMQFTVAYTRGWAADSANPRLRLILTLKQNIAWLTLVPLRSAVFQRELSRLTVWYNRHRPHMTLAGATPDEVYCQQRPANRQPRFEPRPCWPRRSPCARPVTLVKGRAGVRLEMEITIQGGRRHLPIVTLRHAA